MRKVMDNYYGRSCLNANKKGITRYPFTKAYFGYYYILNPTVSTALPPVFLIDAPVKAVCCKR